MIPKKKLDQQLKIRVFGYYGIGIICVWTFFVIFTLVSHKTNLRHNAIEAAEIEARQAFLTHVIYRSWNASHGGVWAPVTDTTRPNPYLKVPERDIQTPSGRQLTKINPAYMTRQVNALALSQYGIKSHITSLNPLRPENKADPWETLALERFNNGESEVSSIETDNGVQYLKLMRPLITEESCLACHASQGYSVGKILGGISVMVPIAPHIDVSLKNNQTLVTMYGFLWLAGIIGTVFFMLTLFNQIEKRFKAEEDLIRQEKLEGVIEMARAVCHEFNQPLQSIMGNSEIILMESTDNKTLTQRAQKIKKEAQRMGELSKKLIRISEYETKEMLQGRIIDIDKSAKKSGPSDQV